MNSIAATSGSTGLHSLMYAAPGYYVVCKLSDRQSALDAHLNLLQLLMFIRTCF